MRRSKILLGAVVVACVVLAMLPTSASCLTRDQAISRGMVWVHYYTVNSKTKVKTYGVPYSQSKWALESGSPVPTSAPDPSVVGYRTDCSGFASMCWQLHDSKGRPYSADTLTFALNKSSAFKLKGLSKNQLQPGDLILKSTVWGASSGHAIIFAGWADSKQKTYWALEQTTTSDHNGTILRTRPWGEAYYRAFRDTMIGDAYSDCEVSVTTADPYQTAAMAADIAFPPTSTASVPALVVASGGSVADQLSGAALAGAVGGPLLLCAKGSVPAATVAEIQRLKPKRIYLLGSTARVKASARVTLSSLCPDVVRINAPDDFSVAGGAARTAVRLRRAAGTPVDTAYVVGDASLADALEVAPISAATGRPILYVQPGKVPWGTSYTLKTLGIRRVIVVGGAKAVGSKAFKALAWAKSVHVSRLNRLNPAKQSIAVAYHGAGLGLGWKGLGLASLTSFREAAASAASQGQAGSMILLTPSTSLDPAVRAEFAKHKAAIGMARVFGNTSSVSAKVRSALAGVLRAP